jgi:predicted RNA-binding Zn-ribbon protein involved in translation (DUF1610 family)
MARSLRLSETWFNRGLWLLALVFASFLIGLGGTIVGDLPQVDARIERETFVDKQAIAPYRTAQETAAAARDKAQAALDQANLQNQSAMQAYRTAQDAFQNWIATRTATQRPDQDAELIARTAQLDELKADQERTQAAVNAQRKALLDARQALEAAERDMAPLLDAAQKEYETALQAAELRVFLYRLALTLPLLGVAGWLFKRQRKSRFWPFVWGFIFFALFAFFVELVPYLPSYGGYVRYAVGIILTLIIGRWAIEAANRYLAEQRQAESQPDPVRRKVLTYDTALIRMSKSACPGCERPIDYKNPEIDFCPHCGLHLFDHCTNCNTRKNAFAPFCHACGAPSAPKPA